jgi:hypothetical protein
MYYLMNLDIFLDRSEHQTQRKSWHINDFPYPVGKTQNVPFRSATKTYTVLYLSRANQVPTPDIYGAH